MASAVPLGKMIYLKAILFHGLIEAAAEGAIEK